MHKPSTQVLIPTVIEQEGRFERAFDIYSRLLRDRVVMLGTDVNQTTANLIVAQMLFLENQDDKRDIIFYINSPGGSVYDGLAIYDTMQYVKCDVQTIGIGVQASMGAFLLASGAKGKRFMLPHATTMIHQPSSGTTGRVSDMEVDLKESIRIKKLLNEVMSKNTGKDIKTIEHDMERDFWMTAKEAVKYGLIDKVLEERPVA